MNGKKKLQLKIWLLKLLPFLVLLLKVTSGTAEGGDDVLPPGYP